MQGEIALLTQAGLTPLPFFSLRRQGPFIQLYLFPDLTPEGIAKVQTVFELELKENILSVPLLKLFQQVQIRPYLLKKEGRYQLISEREAQNLQHEENQIAASLNASLLKIRSVVQWMAVLGKDPIPLTLFKEISSILCPDPSILCPDPSVKPLIHALTFLESYAIVKKHVSTCAEDQSYTVHPVFQEICYNLLSEKQRQTLCKQMTPLFVLQLTKGIKNQQFLHQKNDFYLNHFEALVHKNSLTASRNSFFNKMQYTTLGFAYFQKGLYPKSIEHLKKYLERDQDLSERDDLMTYSVLAHLGNAHFSLVRFEEAVKYHQEELKYASKLNDPLFEASSYGDLGCDYYSLGRLDEALECHQQALVKTLSVKNKSEEARVYGNLANCYRFLGKVDKAIDYFHRCLLIVKELNHLKNEGQCYGNLGNAYHCLGQMHQAIAYHQKALEIAKKIGDLELEEKSYTNLGNGYHSLGEEARAIEYHLQALGVIQKLGLPEAEQRVYCNLGNSYQRLEEYDTALDYYQKQLDIGLKHGYLLAQEVAYGNLGNTCRSLGDYTQALNYQQKSLTVALKIQDKEAVGRTYGNLGHAYFYLGKYAEALECQKKGLKICQEINHQQGIMNSYTNLGRIYLSLHRSVEAERSFCQSVQISQLLLRNAKSPQLQVSFFEGLSTSYLFLEKMLLSQGRMKKALEISDQRRYQALSFLISQKLQLTQQEDSSLSFEKMRQLAQKLQTVFVIYSFAQSKEKIYAWIVTSNEERFYSTSLQIKDNAFFDHAAIFNAFPYQGEQKRPTRRGVSPSVEFQKKLASWYDTLIAPLKPHLPAKESGEILTFIPDDFLAHLPFGAFYNQQEDKYLIEDYPVSVAPSIQVVSFLDQLPKKSCHEVLLMGNPTISKQANGDLPYAEFEVRDTLVPIMNHLTTHVFTQDKATPVSVLAYAPSARLIHIASHGVPHQKPLEKPDPHSVFEGLFKLAIDKDHHLGHLHAGEIALMHLKADLVFMSACHLGRGNLKQEGSIGPVWSFLGAGAKSTIGSYWPLPEGEMTVKMVEVFYRYYLGIGVSQLNKARALREAVLMAMKTERDKPSQWGSFFLTGLID